MSDNKGLEDQEKRGVKMVDSQEVAKRILYNGYHQNKQSHLYIVVGNDLHNQQSLYHWYLKLHVCEHLVEQTPCHACPQCLQVEHDNFINSVVIRRQGDKKSIGVDEVHILQELFSVSAHQAGKRFFCIEDADCLTIQAANSILKFLEEPQGDTVGFLLVKNEQKLLPTIRSRGQLIRMLAEQLHTQIADTHLQKAASYLIECGHEVKLVTKQMTKLYDSLMIYWHKLAIGAPIIVAQTELEQIAIKTKTGTAILDLLMFTIVELLKDPHLEICSDSDAQEYVVQQSEQLYLSAFHALKLRQQHASMSSIITKYSLALERYTT